MIEFDRKNEETLSASIELVKAMRGTGLDMVNVSMNFTTPDVSILWGPAFLAPVAQHVRRETGLPVATDWGVDIPKLCEEVLQAEQLDLVMVGRAHLANPHWPYYEAKELGADQPAWVLSAPYAHWLQRYEPVGPQ